MTKQASNTDVRVEISVDVPVERAFDVFTTRCHEWWPLAYRLGGSERADVVLEPRLGGRWYERGVDGTECDWGRVLAWEPPHHLVLSWQISPRFETEPDPGRASQVDVRFTAVGPDRTTVALVHSELVRHGEGWESMRDSVGGEGGWPGIMRSYAHLVA